MTIYDADDYYYYTRNPLTYVLMSNQLSCLSYCDWNVSTKKLWITILWKTTKYCADVTEPVKQLSRHKVSGHPLIQRSVVCSRTTFDLCVSPRAREPNFRLRRRASVRLWTGWVSGDCLWTEGPSQLIKVVTFQTAASFTPPPSPLLSLELASELR